MLDTSESPDAKKGGVAGEITVGVILQTGPRPRRTELRAFAPKILFVLPKLKAAGLADSSILSRYAFLV